MQITSLKNEARRDDDHNLRILQNTPVYVMFESDPEGKTPSYWAVKTKENKFVTSHETEKEAIKAAAAINTEAYEKGLSKFFDEMAAGRVPGLAWKDPRPSDPIDTVISAYKLNGGRGYSIYARTLEFTAPSVAEIFGPHSDETINFYAEITDEDGTSHSYAVDSDFVRTAVRTLRDNPGQHERAFDFVFEHCANLQGIESKKQENQDQMFDSQSQREWDIYYLGMARQASTKSKDPSTKVGAVIVRPDKTVASLGFNGFPKRMADHPEWYADRGEKLRRILHAEINALHWRKEAVTGYTLYTWPFMPCADCAPDVIQAGISRVVAPETSEEFETRWQENLVRSVSYFTDCGVILSLIRYPTDCQNP